jgi:hypothetical protein
MDTQEIMSSIRRDLETRGYSVGDVRLEWKNSRWDGDTFHKAYVKVEAEVIKP